MIDSDKILNEENPYLREIWSEGYTHITQNRPEDNITLFRESDGYQKEISRTALITKPFTIKRALLKHAWIAESDGSCERFRQLIKPDFYITA